MLDRALRSQGIVSLDSVCYHGRAAKTRDADAHRTRACAAESSCRSRSKAPASRSIGRAPEALERAARAGGDPLVHILSPFDPLIIQRKRLKLFFDYDHRFEAYVPKEKRVLGYFALPVLLGDEIVAALDLKTDRESGKLLVQKWTLGRQRLGEGAQARAIEEELHRFERFQVAA